MITTPKIDEEAFMRSTILYDTSSRLVHPLPLPSCQPDSSGPLRTLQAATAFLPLSLGLLRSTSTSTARFGFGDTQTPVEALEAWTPLLGLDGAEWRLVEHVDRARNPFTKSAAV